MLIISETRYLGKVCEKHPDLGGERRRKNHLCPACMAEKRREARSLPIAQEIRARKARERRARHFVSASDERKIKTLACSLAKARGVKHYTELLDEAREILSSGGHLSEVPLDSGDPEVV